jgi:hypothetical protein
MQIPGFGPKRTVLINDATGQVVLERRPGESVEAFEVRRAAHERDLYERERVAKAAGPAVTAERGKAYAEGRRDQHKAEKHVHKKRGGFGFATAFVVLVAALGVVWLALAAREGSFAAGGAVVDQKVAEVTAPARVAINQTADRTGAAVQNAGQALETQGEKLRETTR